MGTDSINRILELFQECRRSGTWASCFLETRGAAVTATFSVRCENGIENEKIVEEKPRRRITPSRRRRNFKRRKAWLEGKEALASKPAEEESKQSVECVEVVEEVEVIPDKLEKGLVWHIDTIPQLDGLSEASENSKVDNAEDKETDEEPDEHKEYVMPSNTWNMRIFMRTSLNLNNIGRAGSIPNCDDVKKEIKTIFEVNQIVINSIVDVTKGNHNGDCAIVYLQIEKTKRDKVRLLAENWTGKNSFILWESLF